MWRPFLPEMAIFASIIFMVLAEISYHRERLRLVTWIAIGGLLVALLEILLMGHGPPEFYLSQLLGVDGLSHFFKLYFLCLGILTVVVAKFSDDRELSMGTEFYLGILASTLGFCLAAQVTDLVTIFVLLQMLYLVGLLTIGIKRNNLLATEAGIKFQFVGLISSLIYLYGVALIFAETRTLNLYQIREILMTQPMPEQVGALAFVLIFFGLSFCFAAFPLHLWFADVVEGAPAPATLFLCVGLPSFGLLLATRMLTTVFSAPAFGLQPFLSELVAILAALTMLVGGFLSLKQIKLRRMLAFLVLAQIGTILCGLLVLDEDGGSALLFNLLVHLFASVGVFACYSRITHGLPTDEIAKLRGRLKTMLPESLLFLLFLGSLIGLPPLPGFIGRFGLIGAVSSQGWIFLSSIAILVGILCAASFARIAFCLALPRQESQHAYDLASQGPLDEQKDSVFQELVYNPGQRVFLISLAIPVVLLTLFAEEFIRWSTLAIKHLL